MSGTDKDDLDNNAYILDDVSYFESLKNQGLRINDSSESGTFRIIHLEGAHQPYIMDENGNRASSTLEQQCLGSLRIVSEYLAQLKRLGVYDNTTFILTADHGFWGLEPDISAATTPILLVKPAKSTEDSYLTSEVPTGHLDIPATIIESAGGDYSTPDGMPVWDVTQTERPRLYQATSAEEVNGKLEWTTAREWVIAGSARDFENWSKTGREWAMTKD